MIRKLTNASITKIDELVSLCERELLSIAGIGSKTVEEIKNALALSGFELAKDQYGKLLCSRHSEERSDTRIRSYFLCSDCAKEFQVSAFSDRVPIFVLEVVDGPYYCSHCNRKKNLKLYQWYLCDVCDRVVRSISRSVAASIGVSKWWDECKNKDSTLPIIEEFDYPKLKPTGRGSEEAKMDFLWRNNTNSIIFGAEIKTGRNHLSGGSIGSGMSSFQLDVSDIQDILDAMDTRRPFIPAYVFHCQVVDLPYPPTSKFDCVGIWWTSIDSLIDNIQIIKNRPRENRPAAYINTKTFRDISVFVDEEVKSSNYLNCSNPADLRKELDTKTHN